MSTTIDDTRVKVSLRRGLTDSVISSLDAMKRDAEFAANPDRTFLMARPDRSKERAWIVTMRPGAGEASYTAWNLTAQEAIDLMRELVEIQANAKRYDPPKRTRR